LLCAKHFFISTIPHFSFLYGFLPD
jgi:hypothetical protein